MSLYQKLSSWGIHVLERGWLSSNCTLLLGSHDSVLIDSGYHSHSSQTLLWLKHHLDDRPLNRLINTHLHSDHCGGNAALQTAYPNLLTDVPSTMACAARAWDSHQLTFEDTGQHCPPFLVNSSVCDGQSLTLGGLNWRVRQAKGHDPDSVVLFQEEHRILISADALWEQGFGVVFPELAQVDAFEDVERTLDMIEALDPAMVIPGHGPVFDTVELALSRSRSRLAHFRQHPEKHTRHAIKVLIKFKLLEWRRVSVDDLMRWCRSTPLVCTHMPNEAEQHLEWLEKVLDELCSSAALRRDGPWVLDH